MKPRLAVGCLVSVLVGAVSFEVPRALAEKGLGDVARDAFGEFQKQAREMSAPSKAPRTAPTITAHPTFWQCSDGETTLTVDLRGNACYARVRGWSPETPPGGKASSRPASHSLDDGALVQKTQQLAVALALRRRVALRQTSCQA